MEPIQPISNARGIANVSINANGISKIGIDGPNIIPAIDPPVLRQIEIPVTRGLALPIFDNPDTSIKYPVINVPTQEEFDAAVRAEKQKEQEEQKEKSRGLPDKTFTPAPQLPQVVQTPQDNRGISDNSSTNTNLGVPVIEVPLVGQVPVPPKEQVILAGTTATASVAAALIGKSFVEWMVKKFKPIVERIFAQIKKALDKDLTDYELQLFFAYEHQEKINKKLKKEFKKQKIDQYKKANNK